MVFSLFNRNVHLFIKKSSYLSGLDYSNIQSDNGKGISGNSVNIHVKNALLPSIGEFLEREQMNYESEFSELLSISLLDFNTKRISAYKVKLLGIMDDSCGLASYTNSSMALTNAIDEFVERQSLIYSYLSKTPGNRISEPNNIIDIPIYYKDFHFFNISLVNSCFVILGFGIINNKFYIGLGSSIDIKIALKKCIKELNQFYLPNIYKEKINHKNDNFNIKYSKDYSDVFNMLSVSDLINAYKYLESEDNELLNFNKGDFRKVIKELYSKYGINPYIVFQDYPRKINSKKIVKIFDLNWFPNMKPESFTRHTYDFIEKITNKTLDRNCNFIPFP